MNASQRRKSALSYAKRAGLENALGIATADEDDDAIRATEKELDGKSSDELFQTMKDLMDKTGFLEYNGGKAGRKQPVIRHTSVFSCPYL